MGSKPFLTSNCVIISSSSSTSSSFLAWTVYLHVHRLHTGHLLFFVSKDQVEVKIPEDGHKKTLWIAYLLYFSTCVGMMPDGTLNYFNSFTSSGRELLTSRSFGFQYRRAAIMWVFPSAVMPTGAQENHSDIGFRSKSQL